MWERKRTKVQIRGCAITQLDLSLFRHPANETVQLATKSCTTMFILRNSLDPVISARLFALQTQLLFAGVLLLFVWIDENASQPPKSIEQEQKTQDASDLHVNLIADELETAADPQSITSILLAPPQSAQVNSWISDSHVEAIGRRFPNLKRLALNQSRITSAGLKRIAELCPKLEVLVFEGRTSIFPEEFELFPQLSSLKSLRIEDANGPLTDFSFSNWEQWTSLENLDIGNPFILDGIGDIEQLPNLKRLRIGGIANSPLVLAELTLSSSLEVLDIQYLNGANDETLELLANVTPLKRLVICESVFSDSALARFRNVKPDCEVVERKKNMLSREIFDE